MRLLATLSAVAVLGAAGSIGSGPAAAAAICPAQALSSTPACPVGLPLKPPPGAKLQSPALPALSLIGAKYLHVLTIGYRARGAIREFESYYATLLQHLGYSQDLGDSTARTGSEMIYGWEFSRDNGDDIIQFTAVAQGEVAEFSLTRELILPPPRPKGSFVPARATAAVLWLRQEPAMQPRRLTVTSPARLDALQGIVNALALDTRVGEHCAMDPGRAEVIFYVGRRAMTYVLDPACAFVTGPGNTVLFDPQNRLWSNMLADFGVKKEP